MNKPKNIGTTAETAVVRAARTRGFPGADRLTLTGSNDRGDIGLAPGIIVEVKAGKAAEQASDNQITAWLAETETERVNAHAAVAVLVVKRKGVGAGNAHRWAAYLTVDRFLQLVGAAGVNRPVPGSIRLTLDSVLVLLRAAGYGEQLEGNE